MSTISGLSSSTNLQQLAAWQSSASQRLFSKLDTNGDGQIDKSELTAFASQLQSRTGRSLNVDQTLATYDTNGDGTLAPDELTNMMQTRMAAHHASGHHHHGGGLFAKIDTNGDGQIDKSELTALANTVQAKTGQSIDIDQAMSAYDTNGDNALSPAEFSGLMQGLRSTSAITSPATSQQALASYSQNVGGNSADATLLQSLLGGGSGGNDATSALLQALLGGGSNGNGIDPTLLQTLYSSGVLNGYSPLDTTA